MGTVFLFGAGASHGSDTQAVPPLGARLFNELRQFNPDAWGRITGSLADSFRNDFEEAMKSVPPHLLPVLQRAMAAYFFEFKPRNCNLYSELARHIALTKDWSGAACSLNYERLLELSLISFGIQPFAGQRAAGQSGVELCFPHGCCHFFCDSVRGTAAGVSLDGFNVQTDGRVSVVASVREHRARVLQDAFPPVMSYFEPNKRTTAGRSFIQGQRARWKELAAGAITVVIVGVRVRPHDDHIWDPIAATNARIVYCGGPSAASEYRSWAAAAREGRADRILDGYFRDEIASICHEAGR